ncbi:DUF1540 domain-containing protein [Tumebacillus flagellatus]|uniref:DUF1540 domain-containing protein n=1 Tax=Tumebacillus flagellatus TaxID=1157490 RepID=A0A074LSS6_9BACL|nr:DUF1540 domain-containing protein [Tumebacillus flagellatus]KEO83540.1 hypothetical protein EL26_08990 [Tumebacillus flagellatus]
MPEVRCSVSNCSYWAEGGACAANSILVEIDAHANREFNTEFGGDLGENVHKDTAANSRCTMCHTFKAKA